jgi:hypothetical protein
MFPGAAVLGLTGAWLVWVGVRRQSETGGTWYGLFGGLLLWTGWVEFSFVWGAHELNIDPLKENGEVVTKPEYLVMPSSVGLLLATLAYFIYNGSTRCNFFIWMQKYFRMKIPHQVRTKKRNYAIITAMETIYVLWFFYILLLIVYNKNLFGDRHPATYLVFMGSLVWSVYLIIRLLRFSKMAPAVRYAIPTVIIFWNVVEILGRWNFFREIWVEPMSFALEMALIFLAFVLVTLFTLLIPEKQESSRR